MQLSLWREPDGTDGRDGRESPAPARATARSSLPDRLRALGLPPFPRISIHRNEQVMLSYVPGRALRIHEGYLHAPDEILLAIVRFLTPGVRREARLAARRAFLAFPVDEHAPPRPRPARPFHLSAADGPVLARLERLHDELNLRHFGGTLTRIRIRLSDRMRRRLGELRLERRTGRASWIAISRRHIRRDGWAAATDTLLHEMVHQWQAETGRPVDHGADFRSKAREVGIEPRAVRGLG